MLSVFIAFLTYEGLTCNVRVTYAERMPSVLGASTKFIDFMASNIAGRFIRDLSNKPVRNSSYKIRPRVYVFGYYTTFKRTFFTFKVDFISMNFFSVTDVVVAFQVLSIIYLTSISQKAYRAYNCVLEGADVGIYSLRWWRKPEEYHRNATSFNPDSTHWKRNGQL